MEKCQDKGKKARNPLAEYVKLLIVYIQRLLSAIGSIDVPFQDGIKKHSQGVDMSQWVTASQV